jgi:hypothetical protein
VEFLAAALPWISVAILVGVAVSLPVAWRHPERHRDLQLMLNATPRLVAALAMWAAVMIAGAIVLGVGLLGVGFEFGWSLFPIAGAGLLVLGFYAHIAALPLPDFDDPPLDDEATEPPPSAR